MRKKEKDNTEFSKRLLIQESVLIWINTIAMLILAFICVICGYIGELPWLSVMIGLPWGAYGVSQHAYYRKAQAENTKDGIKYDAVMSEYYFGSHDDDDENDEETVG